MPMTITIVFGLASATALVLVLVPAVMGVGNDVARLFSLRADRDGNADGGRLVGSSGTRLEHRAGERSASGEGDL